MVEIGAIVVTSGFFPNELQDEQPVILIIECAQLIGSVQLKSNKSPLLKVIFATILPHLLKAFLNQHKDHLLGMLCVISEEF